MERGAPICSTGFGEAEPPPPPRPLPSAKWKAVEIIWIFAQITLLLINGAGVLPSMIETAPFQPATALVVVLCAACHNGFVVSELLSPPCVHASYQSIPYEGGAGNLHRVFCSACAACKSAAPFGGALGASA